MLFRLLTILFGISALAAGAAAAYLYVWPSPQGPRLRVDQPAQVLHDAVVGHEYAVDFHIINPTGQAHRVVGNGLVCTEQCCIRAELSDPKDVPAHGSLVVTVHVSIQKPGPLTISVPVYLDDGGLREVMLTVTGTAGAEPPAGP